MEVNLENLKKRISEIRENTEKIKKYASITDSEFWKLELKNIWRKKEIKVMLPGKLRKTGFR
jgi:hypothetical protein